MPKSKRPMRLQPEINDMVLFSEFGKQQSLTQVAKILDMPKSTVSRRLAALEAALGIQLLSRSTRKIELTEAGRAYLPYADEISELCRDATEMAHGFADSPQGHLRVSMPPDVSSFWFQEVFAGFIKTYPDIHLEMDMSADQVDLISDHFDCAIRVGQKLSDNNLVARPLKAVRMGIYAHVDYLATQKPIKLPADLAALSYIGLSKSSFERNITLTKGRQKESFDLNLIARTNSMLLLKDMVAESVGAGLMHYSLVEKEVAAGDIIELLPEWQLPEVNTWIVTVNRKLLPRKTQVFIEYVKNEISIGQYIR